MKFLIFYLALLQCGSVFSMSHESKKEEEHRTAELLDELYRAALSHSEERRRFVSLNCPYLGMPFYAEESDMFLGCEEQVAEILRKERKGTPFANIISEGDGVQVSREYRSISLPNDPEVLKREGLALVASFQHSPYSQQVGWWSCGSEYLPNFNKIRMVCRRL